MRTGFCEFQAVGDGLYRCRGGRVVRTRRLPIWSRCDCRIELSSLGQSNPRGERRRPCQHLGEEVGRLECDSCRGRVLVKEFSCRHPRHGRTTLAKCAACPDYAPVPEGTQGHHEERDGYVETQPNHAERDVYLETKRDHAERDGYVETKRDHAERDGYFRGAGRRVILLRFPHGLGDAVQLTTVLLHLRASHPHLDVDVACKLGQETLFTGLARRTFVLDREPPETYQPRPYDLVRTLAWHEPDGCYADSPSTKAEKCLREVFGISPREELCRYQIAPGPEAAERALRYADSIPKPFVLVHYQGNSAARHKNLDEQVVAALCRRAAAHDHAVVVLDWDGRSGLVDGRNVFCPGVDDPLWGGTGTGDGATIAALAQLASWCVGIDSGPAHVFAAGLGVLTPDSRALTPRFGAPQETGNRNQEAAKPSTPTAIVMVQNHPLHYFGLADHVTHLVPDDHARFLRGDAVAGTRYFESRYPFRVYRDLEGTLCRLCDEVLAAVPHVAVSLRETGPRVAVSLRETGLHHAERDGYVRDGYSNLAGLIVDGDCFVRREHRRADMVIVRDVYLDDCYRLEELPRRPRFAVDVGAHIGTAALRLRRRSSHTRVACIEANKANLAALVANVADFAHVIHAACTYEERPIALLSTVFAGTDNTGGSGLVVVADTLSTDDASWGERLAGGPYRLAAAPEKTTLEEIARRCGFPYIDLLKLDCEGSELSILEHCDLSLVRMVVGEYHDRGRFCDLLARRFAGWTVRWLKEGPSGLFWLWPRS
jgi:FkbM family methyltransferase